MATWGNYTSPSTTGISNLKAGQIYAHGGVSPNTASMVLDSISLYANATTAQVRVALYSGGDPSAPSLSDGVLIEDLGILTGSGTEGLQTITSTTNPSIPQNSNIWILFAPDDGTDFPIKGSNVPVIEDIDGNFRSFANKLITDPWAANVNLTVSSSGEKVPSVQLEYSIASGAITGTGALASEVAVISGTASRLLTAIGSLASSPSTLSGTGTVVAPAVITGTGTLLSELATLAGTAERTVTSIGSLQAELAVLSGTGTVIPAAGTITGSGSLLSSDASISGAAQRLLTATGSLASTLATMSGVANRITTVTGSGALLSELATISGSDTTTHTAIGALTAELATLSGVGFEVPSPSAPVSKPSASSNSITSFNLGNVPQVDDYQVYEALLVIHAAIEALATRMDDMETGVLAGIDDLTGYIAAQLNVKTVALDYTVQIGDGTLLVNALNQNVVITLPEAVDLVGTKYYIKCIDATHSAIVQSAGASEIDSHSTGVALSYLTSITVRSDGINWHIV